MGASKEQTKGFQRSKVSIRGEGVEIQVRKLIFGAMPPHVEHPTLTKRIGIIPYTKNDMLHMMLEMEYIMPVIPTPEMYYLVHQFQIYLRVPNPISSMGLKSLTCQWLLEPATSQMTQ